MRGTYIRFERSRDDIIGPTYGPYEFVQITYDYVRAWQDGVETELAHYNGGDWHLMDKERDETVFSDFIVYGLEHGQ